ncbi:DUF721 domain-containing protein [Streptomyces hygroscopicus]|uniref:DUF721 domain-containing protein n=1 Tax=Streptomyces hygroscopicus TaxID=1912 RepID=UPI002240CD12|nr:DUF721 domain-containing protein [Streptomyces hygroscopicus]
MLTTGRARELPAGEASLRERWAAIAPDLAGHVTAVGYDADSGRLTLCPESAAWATKLRREQASVIEAANQSAGRTVARGLQILAAGSVPAAEPAGLPLATACRIHGHSEDAGVGVRGYHQALAAYQAARPERHRDAGIAEAVEGQNRAMRELSATAFPEEEACSDDQPAPIEAARVRRRREADATRAAALHRARADRAQRARTTDDALQTPPTRRAV